MTTQEAIHKAIEGGYPTQHMEALALYEQAESFLEATFWEALVRTMGVEGEFEYIQLNGDVPKKIRQPIWLYYWHRFHSHLARGNTPASFFEQL